MAGSCSEIVGHSSDLWAQAVQHSFLDQCASGSVAPQHFDAWLAQDHHFVIGFTRCLAHLLALAPSQHFQVLIGGLDALRSELEFFQEKAQERNIDLSRPQLQACSSYTAFMSQLRNEDYAVQAAAVWAIEYCYNEAWRRPMQPPYQEFAERWGSDGFSAYVKQLEQLADQALKTSSEAVQARAQQVCDEIARLEVNFWQMALQA